MIGPKRFVGGHLFCPNCGGQLSGVSILDEEETPPPGDGDYSCCIYCSQLSRFQDGKLVALTNVDLIRLRNSDDPDKRALLDQLLRAKIAVIMIGNPDKDKSTKQ